MEWIDTAIVIRIGHFKESDIWVRLLTKKHGILNVFAFGGSRSKRRFSGCLDLLNCIKCKIKTTHNNEYFTLQEAVLLEGTSNLRSDSTLLGLVVNCVRFTDTFGINKDISSNTFNLLQEFMQLIKNKTQIHPLLPLFFRLKLASVHGFAPNFNACARCGQTICDNSHFLINEGILHCLSCYSGNNPYTIALPYNSLKQLRSIHEGSIESWYQLNLNIHEKRACASIIDGFIQYHLGILWENGYFKRM